MKKKAGYLLSLVVLMLLCFPSMTVFAVANLWSQAIGADSLTATENSVEKAGYRLIFQDEFNSPYLNTNLWTDKYLSSWTKTPERAAPTYSIADGIFNLQINADTQPWCPEYDGQTVVSGITTGNRTGLHNWNGSNQVRNPVETELTHINQYGYYEIRAKGQPGSSRHVAWWLLGFEDSPEESAEIDIFEILGNNAHAVPVAFHKWNDPTGPSGGGFSYQNQSKNFHSDYHVYGFDWIENAGSGSTPDKMVFYVDGIKTGERNVNIDYPMIQLFSLYEKRGGGWTGPWVPMPYPNTFGVDYVRVYKKIPTGYTAVSADELEITNIANASLSVNQGAVSLKSYTSQVVGEEGTIYTEKHLAGTKSYVDVTYNDGTVTQEFVAWEAITQQDIDALNNGVSVIKMGTLANVNSTMPGLARPTLSIQVRPTPPYTSNINSENLDKLFDGDATSTNSAWTAIMKPLPADAYIAYDFKETTSINAISFSANYGNGQGLKTFKISTWNNISNSWQLLDGEYAIPWTDAGNVEAGETVQVSLNSVVTTSKIKITVTSANTIWGNKVVMREIAFATVPSIALDFEA